MTKALHIVFLGPPGSGKGTQCKRITSAYALPQISTGDLLRETAKRGDHLGKQVKALMEQGQLIPDHIITEMLAQTLKERGSKGALFDGYPRTEGQAQSLDNILGDKGSKVDLVLNLSVAEPIVIERLTLRRTCTSCGEIYHLTKKAPQKENLCDACGQPLFQRSDDTVETVEKRLAVYRATSAAVLQHYRNRAKVAEVEGEKSIEQVGAFIQKAIEEVLQA